MSDNFPQIIDQPKELSQDFIQLRSRINNIDLLASEKKGLTDYQINAETIFRRLHLLEDLLFDQEGNILNEQLLSDLSFFIESRFRLLISPSDEEYSAFISDTTFGILIHTVNTSLDKFSLRQELPNLFRHLDLLLVTENFDSIALPAKEQILNLLLIHLTSKDQKEYKKRMQTLQRQGDLIGETLSDRGFEVVEKLLYPKS